MKSIERVLLSRLLEDLSYFPAVGLLGPRQAGKTTLAQQVAEERDVVWFDAQRPADAQRLANAFTVLPALADKLVVVDEIQLVPKLFGYLRPIIDEDRHPGRFLLLGSASPHVVKGASESLAGRIAYNELTPLSLIEAQRARIDFQTHLISGGYPEPLLQLPPKQRVRWYENFIRTYITRDLSEFGQRVDEREFRRLIQMLAQSHGALFNASTLARSLTITNDTVRRYISLLEASFLIRILRPWLPNARKRLVKSPRLFVRDSGLLHHLLNISDYLDLTGHIGLGASWEGYVIEEVCRAVGEAASPYFYRTAKGAELDLVLDYTSHRIAFECKFSDAPSLSRGFYQAVEDVQPQQVYVVTPGAQRFETDRGVIVISLEELLGELIG